MAKNKPQHVLGISDKVLEGELDLIEKGTLKKTRTYFVVLSRASRSGKARVELYENIEQSLTLQPKEMLVGDDVIKVDAVIYKGKENAFLISTRAHHYTFIARDKMDCCTWVQKLQDTLLGEINGADKPQKPRVVTEDNCIYESFDDKPEYLVKVAEDKHNNIGVAKEVRLRIENGSIVISTLHGKRIIEWALAHIRRFGREDKTIFFLEVGRKTPTGEGMYKFATEQAESIMRTVTKARGEAEKGGELKSSTGAMPRPSPSPSVAKPAVDMSGPIYDDFCIPPAMDTKPKIVQERQPPLPSPPSTKTVSSYQISHSKNQAQEPLYSNPTMMTEAWKSNGLDEYEDEELYETLNFSKGDSPKKEEEDEEEEKEEEEEHYWHGDTLLRMEGLYATVDVAKKKKNVEK